MKKKLSIQKIILKILSRKKIAPIRVVQKRIKNMYCDEENPIIDKETSKKINYAISRSINHLIENGLVESFTSGRNNKYFRLTKDGKKRANNIILESESSLVSTKWDGFWRIILLDLPEERKNEREALRYLLKKAGFFYLKNSVWISMYPFEYLFINIKKDLNLSKEMMIIVTDKIDKQTEKEFLFACGLENK